MQTLLEVPRGRAVVIERVDGERAFRRRLLEMGLVPGVAVTVTRVAPLGDPLQLQARGTRWSVRRAEAACLWVRTS